MDERKEWIKCSAVSIAFYAICYVILGSTVLSFLNPWLIAAVIILAVGDIIGLKWLIRRFGDGGDDNHYP